MDAMQEAPWVVTFDPKDTLEEKLKKAAHVKPSPGWKRSVLDSSITAPIHLIMYSGETAQRKNPTITPQSWMCLNGAGCAAGQE